MFRINLLLLHFCWILGTARGVTESPKQRCTNACQMNIPLDQIGQWPTDQCQNQSTFEVCKVVISVSTGLSTATINFEPFDNSTDPSDRMPNDVNGLLSQRSTFTFWVPTVNPTFRVTYRCRTGDDFCEKNYIAANWSNIIASFKPQSTYEEFSPLFYKYPSTSGQCYVDDKTIGPCRGYCEYNYLNGLVGSLYSCLSTAGTNTPAQVSFESNRVQIGRADADHDTLSILCNLEKCNDPSTVDRVKKWFGMKEPAKGMATKTNASFLWLLVIFLFNFLFY